MDKMLPQAFDGENDRRRIRLVRAVLLSSLRGRTPLSLQEAQCIFELSRRIDGKNYDRGESFPIQFDLLCRRGILSTESDSSKANVLMKYGWARAIEYLSCAVEEKSARSRCEDSNEDNLQRVKYFMETPRRTALEAALDRRSCRRFARDVISKAVFDFILSSLYECAKKNPGVVVYLTSQGIEGIENISYKMFPDKHCFVPSNKIMDRHALLQSTQGQWWVGGGGGIFWLGVHWDTLRERRKGELDGYLDHLTDLGRMGQALLLALYESQLGAWMTPAINEQIASEVVGSDPQHEEILYLIKFGMPEKQRRKTQ
ncbi:MAG TPA: hypothetical protein VGZ00_12790 [Candidatus Baltobacteraceae bacterium]|nr:hypothetical protein [Candidatus Baltobacteraceae bacterium]